VLRAYRLADGQIDMETDRQIDTFSLLSKR
jgi:hypothetical protein